jgi:hypothetical protein
VRVKDFFIKLQIFAGQQLRREHDLSRVLLKMPYHLVNHLQRESLAVLSHHALGQPIGRKIFEDRERAANCRVQSGEKIRCIHS